MSDEAATGEESAEPSESAEGGALEEAQPPGDGEGTLEGKARRGALWVIIGYGGSQVLRLAGNLILTRMLFEEAFGLMALMSTVLIGLELFSDIGIGPSIIQSKRQDRAFINTAFTMQVSRGIIIYAVACAVAVPFANFYDEPQLAVLLPLVSLTAVIAALDSTKLFTLSRELTLGKIEISMVISQAAGLVTMVVWALVDRSVMALVAGTLVAAVVRMVMTHAYLPGPRDRLAWDKTALRELVRFGRWVFLSTVLTFVAGQSDRLIFGKLVDLDMLGVYYMGAVIAMLPSEALGRLTMQIIFPVYSRVRERDGHFKNVFDQTRWPVNIIAGWAFAGLIAGGPTAVELLYDPRYHEAGWAVQALAIGGWPLIVGNTYGVALFASGVPKWVSLGAFFKVVGMAVFIPLGFWLGDTYFDGAGFQGAVLGFSASELLRYLVAMGSCAALGLKGWGQDVKLTLLIALSGTLGGALEYWMRAGEHNVVLRSAIIAVFVTVFWWPLGWPLLKARLDARRARRAEG